MKIKVFQIHKRSSYVFEEIQDKYSINLQDKTIALSDGATQGFKSEIWAQTLTRTFTENPLFDTEDLIKILKTKAEEFEAIETEISDNFAIKALESKKREKGSFATLLGLKINNNTIDYISSGDVCFFIVRNNGINISYPFSSVQELDLDKGFIGSKKLLMDEIETNTFYSKKFELKKDDILLLTTDAIARHLLKTKSTEICSLENFDEFKNFIFRLWENKELEEDDISIIQIEQIHKNDIELNEFLPSNDFSFPKEEYDSQKVSFANSPQLALLELQKVENQIEQINTELNKSAIKVQSLNKNIIFLKILNYSTLGLLLLLVAYALLKN